MTSPYQEHLSRHSDIREHLGLLHGLAHTCNQVVELGFRTGVSTSAFLAAQCKVYSIDNDPNCKKHVTRLAKLYPDTFTFKLDNSRSAAIPLCDLLFVDTDHTYATTMEELQLHSMRTKRWIALHDTESFGNRDRPGSPNTKHGAYEGVKTAVDHFVNQDPDWRIMLHLPNNNGLTILEKG